MAQQQALILSVNSIAARVGALEAERALASMGRAAKGATSDVDTLEGKLKSAGDSMKRVGRALTIGVSVPLVGLAGFAVKAAADMDSLKRSLNAMTGSSAETAKQMERLKQVARAPGLGFREAVQGSVNLQAVGFAATDAERAIMAFGNAIATTGGGKAELDRVLFQLTQMAATGRIVAQDLRPIIQTAPAVAKALNELFGTTSAEAISQQVGSFEEFFNLLIPKLESMPSVAGGAANSLENLGDAAFRAKAALGDQLLPAVLPLVEGLANLLEQSADLNPELLRTGIAFGAAAVAAGPLAMAVGGLIKTIAALKVASLGLLPFLGVGGAVVIGLSALAGYFVKSKLEALSAAGAVDEFKRSLSGLDQSTIQFRMSDNAARRSALLAERDALPATVANQRGGQNTGASVVANPRIAEINAELATLNSQYGDLARAATDLRIKSTGATDAIGSGLVAVDEKAEKFRQTLTRLREEAERISEALAGRLFDTMTGGGIGGMFLQNNLRPTLAGDRQREAFKSVQAAGIKARAASGIIETVIVGQRSALEITLDREKSQEEEKKRANSLWARLKDVFERVGAFIKDRLKDALNGVVQITGKLVRMFNPLSIAGTMLDQAFRDAVPEIKALMGPVRKIAHAIGQALAPVMEDLAPIFERLAPVISAVAQVFSALVVALMPVLEAMVPILRALFPVFKGVAIAATYLGQAFGIVGGVLLHIVGGIATAVGGAIAAIGKFISKIPRLGDEGRAIQRAGEAVKDFGRGMREAGDEMFKMWDTMAEAREEIKKIGLDETLDDLGSAAAKATQGLLNYARVVHINALRFRAGGGGGGPSIPPSGPPPGATPTPIGPPISLTVNINGITDPEAVANEVVRRFGSAVRRGGPPRLAFT